jgi:hypothetical protein
MVVHMVPHFKNINIRVDMMFRSITYDKGNIQLWIMQLEIVYCV